MKIFKLMSLAVLSIQMLCCPLVSNAATALAPTERFGTTHDLNQIFKIFRSYGTNETHFKLFEEAIKNENEWFFGYHAARNDFRIYQDIIRIAIEEVLNIPIRPDFHFFRIPGDHRQNINSAREFLIDHNYHVIDDYPLEGQQLLSLNMALYEYFWNNTNCCVYFFVRNASFAQHSYKEKLKPFFVHLGIDPVHISKAFDIGRQILGKNGVLFQLFDSSGYKMLNKQAYLSHISGRVYDSSLTPQDILENNEVSSFPQLRLIMSNRYSLNPYSFLIVKRYELNEPAVVEEYENQLRAYFQTLPVDTYKKEEYRKKLLELWDLP